MNGLFGLELPTSVNFVIAFVVVLALIGAATWLVRRFGGARLEAGAKPAAAARGDRLRGGRWAGKLVIIRRDNVEHLLMIGGPTDVVVETNIMRSALWCRARRPPFAPTTARRCRAPCRCLTRRIGRCSRNRRHWRHRRQWHRRPSGCEPTMPRNGRRRPSLHRRRCPCRHLRLRRPHRQCARNAATRRLPDWPPSACSPFRRHPPPRVRASPRRRAPWPSSPRPPCRSSAAAAANDANLTNMALQLEAALRRPVQAEPRTGRAAPHRAQTCDARAAPGDAEARRCAKPRAGRHSAAETALRKPRAGNGKLVGPTRKNLTS